MSYYKGSEQVFLIRGKIYCNACRKSFTPGPPCSQGSRLLCVVVVTGFSSGAEMRIDKLPVDEPEVFKEASQQGWGRENVHGTILHFCPECMAKESVAPAE